MATIGPVWGLLNDSQREKVIIAVAKEARAKFENYLDTVVDAFRFRRPGPAEREEMYATRMAEVWMQLANFDDKLFNELMTDWEKLERNRMNKTLSAFNPFEGPLSPSRSGNQFTPPGGN